MAVTQLDPINTALYNLPSSARLPCQFLRYNNTVASYSTALICLAVKDMGYNRDTKDITSPSVMLNRHARSNKRGCHM